MRVRAIVAMWFLVDAGAGRSCSVHRIRRSEPFCTTRLHLDCWLSSSCHLKEVRVHYTRWPRNRHLWNTSHWSCDGRLR